MKGLVSYRIALWAQVSLAAFEAVRRRDRPVKGGGGGSSKQRAGRERPASVFMGVKPSVAVARGWNCENTFSESAESIFES